MLTLLEMQKSSIAQLRTIALETDNRQYSIACDQMASAMECHAIGAKVQMDQHVERCKTAYKRAQEDEAGQIRRVRKVKAVVEERGVAQDPTRAGGKDVVKLAAGRKGATWLSSWARNR